jgi:hypothetical protein
MSERDDRERANPREAARERAARVKRWVAGSALALTGIFSALAAAVLPASHASSNTSAPTQTPSVAGDDESSGDHSQTQSSSRAARPQSQPQPVTTAPDISPPAAVPQPPPAVPQPSVSGGGAVSGGS